MKCNTRGQKSFAVGHLVVSRPEGLKKDGGEEMHDIPGSQNGAGAGVVLSQSFPVSSRPFPSQKLD